MTTRRSVLAGIGAGIAAASTFRAFPALAQARPFRIGVLLAEIDDHGQDQMVEPYVSQMKVGLELAAAEINAAGGLMGRPVEFVYRNDGGSPAPGAAAAVALIQDDGCEALVSGFIIAIRSFLTRSLGADPTLAVPVLHGFGTEGSFCGPLVSHFGPTTAQSLGPMVKHLGEAAGDRPFTISDWTPSQRTTSLYLYNNIGGVLTGAALVTTPVEGNSPGEFRGVIRWADEMRSKIIYNSVPRPYSVNAVNQAVELGLAEGKTFAYLDFSEWHARQLVAGASAVTCLPFVAGDPAVQEFVARAQQSSGGDLVTHVAFTHYNSLMALKAAVEKSGEATAAAALEGLKGISIETATGTLTLDGGGYATMPMFVAQATPGRLEVVERVEAVASGKDSC